MEYNEGNIGSVEIDADPFNEVHYACTSSGCGNTQTIRYFLNDPPFPATCCVKCRAGFGSDMSYGAMAARGVGMLPYHPEPVEALAAEAVQVG